MLLNIGHVKDVHFVHEKYGDGRPSIFNSVEG